MMKKYEFILFLKGVQKTKLLLSLLFYDAKSPQISYISDFNFVQTPTVNIGVLENQLFNY